MCRRPKAVVTLGYSKGDLLGQRVWNVGSSLSCDLVHPQYYVSMPSRSRASPTATRSPVGPSSTTPTGRTGSMEGGPLLRAHP